MHAPIKYVEKICVLTAHAVWLAFSAANRLRPRPSFIPAWSDTPLLKTWQKTKPPLGWPRETDSLCPLCVREARNAILDGTIDLATLEHETPGEIKATILERDGKILMVKDCPVHGHFEDIMATDTEFFRHLEQVFPGRDIAAHKDERVHHHGSSTIRHGRGSVLTVDLTNRCNMMCDPCFMDANQVGFVHELSWDDIKQVLDNAISIKPRRQMSIQFSGGEPTLSPHFLDAVRYARHLGYRVIQAATNGIAFAQSAEFAKAAGEAGLRYAYLQFDGIGNAPNAHRRVGNLFDVKLQAIEHLWNAGVSIVPVVTVVNGINNEQVGRVIHFALDNPRRIAFVSFQPVSFSGRDEAISDERRHAQRYTLSHLAHDVRDQTGLGDPVRDWFPLSFMGPFTDWADLGAWAECGVGTGHVRLPPELRRGNGRDGRSRDPRGGARDGFRRRRTTGERRGCGERRGPRPFPVCRGDGARTDAQLRPVQGANTFQVRRSRREIRSETAPKWAHGRELTDRAGEDARQADIESRRASRWNFLFIAGMWFQDLFNYDFRRTEMCIIPYATQQGEISFCAYNTGIGWRNIIEKMHMTATLTKWYEEHGRHEIFAGNKAVPLPTTQHALKLNAEAVAAGEQQDLVLAGVARNSREEKIAARAAAHEKSLEEKVKEDAHHRQMADLYRQHVLKEAPKPPVPQIQGLKGSREKSLA